jgi:hypothetical protein|tara:strand:- start:297 stop:533 length:237 start_codon:yes stop_codon:yes gene_type:complete
MQKIKLIWDFNGLDSLKTAQHFNIHLEEFLSKEDLPYYTIGVDSITEFHNIAFLIIDKNYIDKIKQALKPQRAFLINN